MHRLKAFFSILFLMSFIGQAQLNVHTLHFINRIESAENSFADNQKNHSAVLPVISNNFSFAQNKGTYSLKRPFSSDQTKPVFGKIYPLGIAMGGYEAGANSNAIYDLGLGMGVDLSFPKLFFTGKFIAYSTSSGFVRDSVQHLLNMDPGTNRALFDNGYQQSELLLAYRPHRIFTFIGGYGKNFFGEGYRSLILSDNAAPNPFFKIETAFGPIKYVNIYNVWNDNTMDPENKTLDRRKFSSMHYISWNITREFNLSVFETVVWQANDTLVNRGFDPNYLNPIVFYRPVEYGNGSADNVLLGANMSFKFDNVRSIYTQFILDDFLLAEIRARSRWWANKYGVQFGYKSRQFLNKENLYFQLEFNTVRPFTYSHKSSAQSYGHLNASVTHPVGASFFELLNITSYKTDRFRLTNKLTYSSYGTDTSALSNGQNLFVSYSNRNGDYDHFIAQGFKKNVLNETIIIETPLLEDIHLYLNFTYNWRFEVNPETTFHQHTFLVGIRSRIWNKYTDF